MHKIRKTQIQNYYNKINKFNVSFVKNSFTKDIQNFWIYMNKWIWINIEYIYNVEIFYIKKK